MDASRAAYPRKSIKLACETSLSSSRSWTGTACTREHVIRKKKKRLIIVECMMKGFQEQWLSDSKLDKENLR